MPSSPKWASQRLTHFPANSESGSSRGRKSAEKAERRPAVLVPTIWSMGISMTPSSVCPATMESLMISSNTWG